MAERSTRDVVVESAYPHEPQEVSWDDLPKPFKKLFVKLIRDEVSILSKGVN